MVYYKSKEKRKAYSLLRKAGYSPKASRGQIKRSKRSDWDKR